MTEDQKRAEKGALLLAYQEAEENLAFLRQKANRMAGPFSTVSAWLKYIGSFEKKIAYGEDYSGIGDSIIKDVEEFRAQLNLDAVLSVTHEIKTAEELLKDLKHRKEQLRVK